MVICKLLRSVVDGEGETELEMDPLMYVSFPGTDPPGAIVTVPVLASVVTNGRLAPSVSDVLGDTAGVETVVLDSFCASRGGVAGTGAMGCKI